MILPVGAKSFKEALCIGCEVGAIWSDPFCCGFPLVGIELGQVYHSLKSCIKKKYGQA